MKKEEEARRFDVALIDERASELALRMAHVMCQPGLNMHEAIASLVGGICKLIQALSLTLGTDPQCMRKLVLEGIETFFEVRADSQINDLFKRLQTEELN